MTTSKSQLKRLAIMQNPNGTALIYAEAYKAGRDAQRESDFELLFLSRQELLLITGELTASQLRTAFAILANRSSAIRTNTGELK